MTDNNLVSVVMIFLNAERFIREAIDSVFAQTYRNWELLLVDDGSNDGSSGIASGCAKAHPHRVRYLEHQEHSNRGMSSSRNLGIRNATGAYVAFLDSDDVWLPEKLAQQVAILEAQPSAAMVYGPTRYWYGWTGRRRDSRRDFIGDLCVAEERLYPAPELLTVYLETKGKALPGICSLLARRTAIDAVGGFDETFRGTYEDQVFLSKVCFTYPVFVTGRCTDHYRQHSNSHCTVATETGDYHPCHPNPSRGRYLRWLGDYLSEQSCQEPALLNAFQKEFSPYRYRAGGFTLRSMAWKMKETVKRTIKRIVPPVVWQGSKAILSGGRYPPPVGWVRFGSLRRIRPISGAFGYDRGLPVDRYYIEAFLERQSADIRGRTLEVGEDTYTRRFGADRVTQRDVLHVDPGAPGVTIVADLTRADSIPSDSFDCFICTQTLQLIHDIEGAIATIHRILKPGGILLATVPGVSQISSDEWSETWSWSFSTTSVQRLFGDLFPPECLTIQAHGNVLVATAFLHGLATEELRKKELDHFDPEYEFLITVRAVKPPISAAIQSA